MHTGLVLDPFVPLIPLAPLVPVVVFMVLAAFVLRGPLGFVVARGVDMNTDGSSLIGRSNPSNSRWKEAALIRVILSAPMRG